MAQLVNIPVLFCHRCGKPLIGFGETYNDPAGAKVHLVSRVLAQNAICKECREKRLFYIAEGRLEDWEAGRP